MKNSGQSKIFYGWWVVAACSLILLLSGMSRFSLTILMPTLEADLGWTRATLGFGMTIHMWVYACASILVGILVDKYGARRPMIMGGVLIITAAFLVSKVSSPVQFYIFYGGIMGLGVSFSYFVPAVATARAWFDKKGALAIAITSLGSAIGIAAVSFIIPGMVEKWGWRTSWFYVGLGAGLLIILLSLVIRRSPATMGLYPDGVSREEFARRAEKNASGEESCHPAHEWTVKDALKTPSFWFIAISYTAFTFPSAGIVAHVASWGLDIAKMNNLTPTAAQTSISASMIGISLLAVVGMLLGGILSDKFGKKTIGTVALVSGILITLAFTRVTTMSGFVISMLFFGLIPSFFYPIWSALLGDIFGTKPIATLISIGIFTGAVVGGTGSYVYGWAFTTFGNYNVAFLISAGCFLLSTVLILLAKTSPRPSAARWNQEPSLAGGTEH